MSVVAYPQSDRKDAAHGRPNVVLIVLDDLGFAQLGCYGGQVDTPSIDRVAARGLRYNSFHVTALCSPTRASLLTGRNHHAVGMGFLTDAPSDHPGYTGRIPEGTPTLPSLLNDAGYSAYAVGKWHLVPLGEHGPAGPFGRWPLGLGFERYFGFLGGADDHWHPDLVVDNGFVEPPDIGDDYHLTTDLVSKSIGLIATQRESGSDRPFFLYLALGAVHEPHHVAKDWADQYRHKFDDGWEVVRHQVFDRQKQIGIIPDQSTLTGRPDWVRRWLELSEDERLVFARQMEVFGGFLSHTDAEIGRLMSFIESLGELDNTIVVIMSDNGASAEGGPNGWMNHVDDFDRTDPTFAHRAKERLGELGGPTSYNHYAWGWAWAGNTPFKLWKRYAWLGGTRVPLVISWPEGIARSEEGAVRSQFCHVVDLLPTVLDVAGIRVPSRRHEFDGASIKPTFNEGQAQSPRSVQYFEIAGSRAIYFDGWKATTDHVDSTLEAERLLIPGSQDFDEDSWSLYNLEEDFTESHNLAKKEGKQLDRMIDVWFEEARKNGVFPLMDGLLRPGNSREEDSSQRPRVYRAHEGVATLPDLSRGFTLEAHIEVKNAEGICGVICSQGDGHGGWSLYCMDGLVVVSIALGGERLSLRSQESIVQGLHTVTLDIGDGSASLCLDGTKVDELDISNSRWDLLAYILYVSGSKFLVGRGRGVSISSSYSPPFHFNGRVDRVVVSPRVGEQQDGTDRVRTSLRLE